MKLLLDTNVIIDYYARRKPYFEDAKLLRIAAFFMDVELWVSPQSFTDAEYVLRRAVPVQHIRSMMAESLSFFNVSSPSAQDVAEGLHSNWPDLEDFLVARCAERVKADCIITRDASGFAEAKIKAVSPAEFFEMLKSDYGIAYDIDI